VVQAELEVHHDAEVAAAAPNSPEELGVLVGAGGEELAVGRDDVDREELVDGEPVLAHDPADPAPEGEPGQAGMGDDP
jgi:hypothetical protein